MINLHFVKYNAVWSERNIKFMDVGQFLKSSPIPFFEIRIYNCILKSSNLIYVKSINKKKVLTGRQNID